MVTVGLGCIGNSSLWLTFSSPSRGHFYGDGYGQGLHTLSWLLNGILLSTATTPPTIGAELPLDLVVLNKRLCVCLGHSREDYYVMCVNLVHGASN